MNADAEKSIITCFEDGRPEAKEGAQPLDTGKGKETESLPRAPRKQHSHD